MSMSISVSSQVVQGQELNIEFYDDDDRSVEKDASLSVCFYSRSDEVLGRAKIQTSLVAQRGHIGKV